MELTEGVGSVHHKSTGTSLRIRGGCPKYIFFSFDSFGCITHSLLIIAGFVNETIARINAKLGDFFPESLLTDKALNVNLFPVPPGGGGLAYYEAGTADGKRKGGYYINLQDPSSLPKVSTRVSVTVT